MYANFGLNLYFFFHRLLCACAQRISELCCFAVSQLLSLGTSVISNGNHSPNEEEKVGAVIIEWPEDSLSKAMIIRVKAQSMSGDVEAVSNSFIAGIAASA